MAEHRDATGIDVIRGLVLTRIGAGASESEPITDRADWFAVLGDLFDMRFDDSAPETLDRLWEGVIARHRAWEAAGEG
jgi:N-hydroxyarylamine O-acetyltransferase